jgi:hypothetical protein
MWLAGGLTVWAVSSCSNRESETFVEGERPAPAEAEGAQPAEAGPSEGGRPPHVDSATPNAAGTEQRSAPAGDDSARLAQRSAPASGAGRAAPAATDSSAAPPDRRPTLGMCGKCALDYCAAPLVPVNDNLAAVEPILSCVLGKDWPAGERAAPATCGNLDLLGCYCGTTSPLECATMAPEALDGTCREQLLTGTGCRDSACLQASLLDAGNTTGKALQYLRCTQDFCYDYCFNP